MEQTTLVEINGYCFVIVIIVHSVHNTFESFPFFLEVIEANLHISGGMQLPYAKFPPAILHNLFPFLFF